MATGGRKMQWKRRLAIGVLSLGILVGCATTGEQMATKEKSLYDRLGGKPAITAVVDDFTARVAADRRINRFFAIDGQKKIREPEDAGEWTGQLARDTACLSAPIAT
jgi:Bacterial-like globin